MDVSIANRQFLPFSPDFEGCFLPLVSATIRLQNGNKTREDGIPMKRRSCKYLLTAALLCAALTLPAKAARRRVPVQADAIPVSAAAYVEQGVTYVPLRALLNALGSWQVSVSRIASTLPVGRRSRAGGGHFRQRQPPGRSRRECDPRQRNRPVRPRHRGKRRDLCPPAAGVRSAGL